MLSWLHSRFATQTNLLPDDPDTAQHGRVVQDDPAVQAIARLAQDASNVGRDAADVRGRLEDTGLQAATLRETMKQLSVRIQAIEAAQGGIANASQRNQASVQSARSWVNDVTQSVNEIRGTIADVAISTNDIREVALQTRLLAFNATVEARRAGESGRGFAVVADAVRGLADEVDATSGRITAMVTTLLTRIDRLAADIKEPSAGQSAGRFYGAVQSMTGSANDIADAGAQTVDACDWLNRSAVEALAALESVDESIRTCLERSDGFLAVSERMIEAAASAGVRTADTGFVELAQSVAALCAASFEEAIARGSLSVDDVFDDDYRELPGTDPKQYSTRFLEWTDRCFPALQEPIIEAHPRVVFCIASDRNGYVPTHNRRVSRPQGSDAIWNAANARNRRIFADRTGLASSRNTKPFLLQTYRRDMGGGRFVLMKEASAPISVAGRHWGGVRLAFPFDE